jgi:tetratricopeptide (TPR) repeat protein
VYVETPEVSPDWDYSLILPAKAKINPELLAQWPPQGTVHEIKVDNTPLVAIVKNYATVKGKTPQSYLTLSLQYYEAGQYERCIEVSREALKMKPDYAPAYNNICAAYNELKMWDKGIAACQQALKIEPGFQLARNNLNWALSAKAAKK